MAHAELSPSSAVRWMACPGSVALTKGMADTSSAHADEGTLAHEFAEAVLAEKPWAKTLAPDMVENVTKYVNYVRDVVRGVNGTLLVEQRLPISGITGEPDAHGTSDVVILSEDELIVVDLKYGMGVAVEAENNPQLQIYALAALHEFGLVQDFKTVRMVIHQPRLNSVTEWVQTVEELEAFGKTVAEAAVATAMRDAPLVPSAKGCRWCKAKATCPALRAEVMDQFEVVPDTAEPDALADSMSKVDLIEGWCKAVRAEAERRLLAGEPVAGFKIVQGKRGNRQWSDATTAEQTLKTMRLKHDEMYEYKLISPTTAENLAKDGAIGPRQWPKVLELITQSDGKPSVAPESDKRPALVMSAVLSDFDDVTDLA